MKKALLINKSPEPPSPDDRFETLYNQYRRNVYRICLSITKDSDIAQDCTQDVFMKAFAKLGSFQNRSAMMTWLYTIAHHHCLDQIRLGKRLPLESLSDSLSDTIPEANTTDPLEQQLHQLRILLKEMPADDIALLRLKYEDGVTIRDLSEQYNLSESAVKMRLKRMRDSIRKLYSHRAESAAHQEPIS